ncbi:Aldehyde dehydrogenase family 8 member A1 [Nymphon striatum]|nr:Aldehyde dehydrogenase family 8 member A1 [Nymphon striatum]
MEYEVTAKNFINGEFVDSAEFIDSFDPSVGKPWAKIPNSSREEVLAAVKAAKDAFPLWSKMLVSDRCHIMTKIADLIESKQDELAAAESRDQGKPLWLVKMVDIPRAAINFRHFASVIQSATNMSMTRDDQKALYYTSREPVGVAGLISPWNFPLYLLTFKIAPAIAFGNTVVAKPSEMTSVTASMICSIFKEAAIPDGFLMKTGSQLDMFYLATIFEELQLLSCQVLSSNWCCLSAFNCVPPGVINIVHGTGPRTGEAILENPDVSLLSFTGSTAVGKRILESSAKNLRKVSLELGGKNPAIVCDDVDLDKCIPELAKASFVNQGEVCLASSRIYVAQKIYRDFLDRFISEARKWKVGPPSKPDTKVGALISEAHMKKVKTYIDLARKEGATICCGHGVDDLSLPPEIKNGYYVLPTVITNIADTSRCMTEEIFGPVTCIVPFETEEEAITKANSLNYGLSASVWTQSISKSQRISRALQAGTVWVNCWMLRDLRVPFGGYKMSGIGREGSVGSHEFFTEEKTTCIRYD